MGAGAVVDRYREAFRTAENRPAAARETVCPVRVLGGRAGGRLPRRRAGVGSVAVQDVEDLSEGVASATTGLVHRESLFNHASRTPGLLSRSFA